MKQENIFEEGDHPRNFLTTENIRNVIKSVDNSVRDNAWIYVHGDVGSGKSELKMHLLARWQRDPKYCIVQRMGWLRPGSRVAALMKRMITAIDPDQHVPGDIELRAERLKTQLMKAHRAKRKVVVLIDEAQDLSESTFRELKKIREITGFGVDHLFSVVMFAKESLRGEAIFAGRELGYRIRQAAMLPLNAHEICEFAEKKFGLKFPSGEARRIRSYFSQMAHPSPLGVKYLCESIHDLPGFNGTLTLDIIQAAIRRGESEQLRKYHINNRAVQKAYQEKFGGHIAESTVSDINNGKTGRYADKTVQQLDEVKRDLLSKAKTNERLAM